MKPMKQQCYMAMIYLSWGVYVAGAVFLFWRASWIAGVGWLILAPALQWLYVRKFPAISPAMGYGSIADRFAEAVPLSPAKVTLYTALGCPFCPLMEERLEALGSRAGFTLEKIDVTLRPDLLTSKGIRSVPAVEIDGRLFAGLLSTADLAAAIGQGGE